MHDPMHDPMREWYTASPSPPVPVPDDARLERLAHGAATGNRPIRDALWETVGPSLERIARRSAAQFALTEPDDAAQEAYLIFAALVADWGAEPSGATFGVFLFGMFRFRLLNALRAYERHAPPPAALVRAQRELSGAAGQALWHDYGAELRAFAQTLPATQRDIFLLRTRDGMSGREAAAHLGLSTRTVSRYWGVTLRRLRE